MHGHYYAGKELSQITYLDFYRVFLTQDEAEEALKGMEREDNR